MTDARFRVGLIGARGHVGAELVRLIYGHPSLELAFVSSRQLEGRPLSDLLPEATGASLAIESLGPIDAASREVDAVFLALPNGHAAPYVAAIDAASPRTRIVDLSADHRFSPEWSYGLPERTRAALRSAERIANPGCYATAAELALDPLVPLLARPPSIFGVSGYSGAGTTPSPKNDAEALRDNLMPYALTGHVHEREIAHHLGAAVRFMPHVAPFFRGITLTIDCELTLALDAPELSARYEARYAKEPLVKVTRVAPLVRDAAHKHTVQLGGFTTDGTRAVVVATIDNLLKGAATQALENANLALGLPELAGIPISNSAD